MSVWYGGVKLTVPDQDNQAWIEGNISLKDVYEFRAYSWPPSGNASWPVPPDRDTDRPIKLGSLFWPRGAQRWATFHYLINQPQLDDVRALVYEDDTYTPLKLKIADGKDEDIYIDPLMYMLPPRPLQRTSWDAEHDWFLLTLVDQRYFWWEKVSNIEVTEGTTTWAQLYALIATALGATITVSTVDADYLKPTAAFSNRYAHLPRLLDAVANSCGQRIVRKLDGTVLAQSYTAAKAQYDLNIDLEAVKRAGGHFDFDDTETNDLAALVPSSVTVVFPRADSGAVGSSFHTVNTTLTSLALAEFTDVTARSFTHLLRSSCIANFTGGGSPANNTEIAALAAQMTTDWYKWQLGDLDIRLAGIYEWEPEGLHDHIEWSHDCTMRIQRGEWNELEDAQQHYGTYGTSTTVVQNDIVVNDLTVNQTFIQKVTEVTLGGNQNNYLLLSPITYFDLTANIIITGIDVTIPLRDGIEATLINKDTTYNIELPDSSASSDADKRFEFPSGDTYFIYPLQVLILIYINGKWRPKFPTLPRLNNPWGFPIKTKPLTADDNAFDPRPSSGGGLFFPGFVRLQPDMAGWNIGGIVAGELGQPLRIYNDSAYTSTLRNEYAPATAANRVITGTGANVTVPSGGFVDLQYITSGPSGSRWYMTAPVSGGGTGTVTSFSAGDLTPLFTTSEATATTTPALTFSQITKTANYVFAGPTSGGAANPDFRALVAADVSGVAHVKIASGSVTNAASMPITGLTGYTHYRIILHNVTAKNALGSELRMRTSTDNGSTYDSGASDYRTTPAVADAAYISVIALNPDDSSANHAAHAEILLFNPGGSPYKMLTFSTVLYGPSDLAFGGPYGAIRKATADIDAVTFYMGTGNMNGSYQVWGFN